MHTRLLVLLIIARIGTAASVSAQDDGRSTRTDLRGDSAAEAAVDAELGGDRTRAATPRERTRKSSARETPQRKRDHAPAGDRPRRKKPITLGLLLGYGLDLEEGFGINPWGVGFGARGGYNVGPIFLGGRFVFYLGEDPSNIWEIGVEGGYDLKGGALTVRPGFGFGLASYVVDVGIDSETDARAYVAPGLSLLFDVSRDAFVGVDGRVQFILSKPEGLEAIILLGNVGMRF
jgi:hypothetical protein